jgi:SAM-dependent methyltransferase
MSRWNRAARLLDLPSRSRVLDLGCAFGFGTRMLLPKYSAFGHDLNAAYIDRARKSLPKATFTSGTAESIPYPDGFFDGVLLLDVLEHVRDEKAVLQEIHRILRPGGCLVVSVPNDGLLAGWDSLNVYRQMFGGGRPAPTDDPSWTISPQHRHYSLERLEALVEDGFQMRTVQYTGLGLAEPINLLLLLAFRALLPLPRVYRAAQYVYFAAYLAEDRVVTGRYGYHLMALFSRR